MSKGRHRYLFDKTYKDKPSEHPRIVWTGTKIFDLVCRTREPLCKIFVILHPTPTPVTFLDRVLSPIWHPTVDRLRRSPINFVLYSRKPSRNVVRVYESNFSVVWSRRNRTKDGVSRIFLSSLSGTVQHKNEVKCFVLKFSWVSRQLYFQVNRVTRRENRLTYTSFYLGVGNRKTLSYFFL